MLFLVIWVGGPRSDGYEHVVLMEMANLDRRAPELAWLMMMRA
jgi:hypothetical protein